MFDAMNSAVAVKNTTMAHVFYHVASPSPKPHLKWELELLKSGHRYRNMSDFIKQWNAIGLDVKQYIGVYQALFVVCRYSCITKHHAPAAARLTFTIIAVLLHGDEQLIQVTGLMLLLTGPHLVSSWTVVLN